MRGPGSRPLRNTLKKGFRAIESIGARLRRALEARPTLPRRGRSAEEVGGFSESLDLERVYGKGSRAKINLQYMMRSRSGPGKAKPFGNASKSTGVSYSIKSKGGAGGYSKSLVVKMNYKICNGDLQSLRDVVQNIQIPIKSIWKELEGGRRLVSSREIGRGAREIGGPARLAESLKTPRKAQRARACTSLLDLKPPASLEHSRCVRSIMINSGMFDAYGDEPGEEAGKVSSLLVFDRSPEIAEEDEPSERVLRGSQASLFRAFGGKSSGTRDAEPGPGPSEAGDAGTEGGALAESRELAGRGSGAKGEGAGQSGTDETTGDENDISFDMISIKPRGRRFKECCLGVNSKLFENEDLAVYFERCRPPAQTPSRALEFRLNFVPKVLTCQIESFCRGTKHLRLTTANMAKGPFQSARKQHFRAEIESGHKGAFPRVFVTLYCRGGRAYVLSLSLPVGPGQFVDWRPALAPELDPADFSLLQSKSVARRRSLLGGLAAVKSLFAHAQPRGEAAFAVAGALFDRTPFLLHVEVLAESKLVFSVWAREGNRDLSALLEALVWALTRDGL